MKIFSTDQIINKAPPQAGGRLFFYLYFVQCDIGHVGLRSTLYVLFGLQGILLEILQHKHQT